MIADAKGRTDAADFDTQQRQNRPARMNPVSAKRRAKHPRTQRRKRPTTDPAAPTTDPAAPFRRSNPPGNEANTTPSEEGTPSDILSS